MLTIENRGYVFWDANGIFPGESVGDAFQRAGASVQYIDSCEVMVYGLDQKEALKIAREYDADYLGPIVIVMAPRPMKDVTPNSCETHTGDALRLVR